MGIEVLIPLLAVFSIFFIPITGLMLILTTRFALKPLVETLARALKESGYSSSPDLLNHMRTLSEQVETLATEVQQLREAQEFDRKLLETRRDHSSGFTFDSGLAGTSHQWSQPASSDKEGRAGFQELAPGSRRPVSPPTLRQLIRPACSPLDRPGRRPGRERHTPAARQSTG